MASSPADLDLRNDAMKLRGIFWTLNIEIYPSTWLRRSRNVPPNLNKQVRNYYEYLWAHHRGVKEDTLST